MARTMNGEALRIILDAERTALHDTYETRYDRTSQTYQALKDVDLDAYNRVVERYHKMRSLSDWAIETFVEQHKE